MTINRSRGILVTNSEHNHPSDTALLKRLLIDVKPYWPYIFAVFVVDLLATPLALLAPVPLKIIVDNVLGTQPTPTWIPAWFETTGTLLMFAVGLLLFVTLLKQLQSLVSALLRTYAGEKLILDFRSRLFRHAQRLSLAYHDRQGTSDSTYRLFWDTAAVRYVAVDSLPSLLTSTFTLVAMIYVILRIDWQLAIVAMIVSPFLYMLARLYRTRLRQQSKQTKRLESSALGVVQEVLSSLRIVKAFGQEQNEQQRFELQSNKGLNARLRYTASEGMLGLLLGMTTALGTAAVLTVGVRQIQRGMISLGDLLLVMGYLAQLYDPLNTMSRKVASLQNHLASADRAYAVLDLEPDVQERKNARPLIRAQGNVSFQNISFAYDGHDYVLHDITFDVPAGAKVGIAGRTGAGKTTLISLLTRFYDPSRGLISLDGIDLRDYQLQDLRNQYAIVLQEPILFSTTIAENIIYGRKSASQDEVIRAAELANARTFIEQLPERYDTQVGERGMRLSGGERQRIALARAFLKDAPILIMDEPTSSVDMKTESAIIDAMERLMQGRTTFMIAHRLTTLESCDLLVMIENGRLVETRTDVSASLKKAIAQGGLQFSGKP